VQLSLVSITDHCGKRKGPRYLSVGSGNYCTCLIDSEKGIKSSLSRHSHCDRLQSRNCELLLKVNVMIQYPQLYKVTSFSKPGVAENWISQASHESSLPEFTCAIPKEFEGPGGGMSPEDFYALSLVNCFVATFKVFAEKSKVSFNSLNAEGVLTVDRDSKGQPWMAKFHFRVRISGSDDSNRVKAVLEKTSRSCLILNSVNTEKTFEFEVS
jgi:organic hydroperoxide reductase OsmC/OhrA